MGDETYKVFDDERRHNKGAKYTPVSTKTQVVQAKSMPQDNTPSKDSTKSQEELLEEGAIEMTNYSKPTKRHSKGDDSGKLDHLAAEPIQIMIEQPQIGAASPNVSNKQHGEKKCKKKQGKESKRSKVKPVGEVDEKEG